jgi:hypothetical protein
VLGFEEKARSRRDADATESIASTHESFFVHILNFGFEEFR